MTPEAIPASGDRLRILSFDRRVEVVGYVLDNVITRTARCDIPAVAPVLDLNARSSEAIYASVRIAVYVRIEFGQASSRNRLGDIDERGPESDHPSRRLETWRLALAVK